MKLRGINFAKILDWYLGTTAWGITTTTFLVRNHPQSHFSKYYYAGQS